MSKTIFITKDLDQKSIYVTSYSGGEKDTKNEDSQLCIQIDIGGKDECAFLPKSKAVELAKKILETYGIEIK